MHTTTAPQTIAGFTRSDIDGKWYADGAPATDAQAAHLDRMAAERAARPVHARCDQHPAYDADNCPSCGTSQQVAR